jgi:hypothetical protein
LNLCKHCCILMPWQSWNRILYTGNLAEIYWSKSLQIRLSETK